MLSTKKRFRRERKHNEGVLVPEKHQHKDSVPVEVVENHVRDALIIPVPVYKK